MTTIFVSDKLLVMEGGPVRYRRSRIGQRGNGSRCAVVFCRNSTPRRPPLAALQPGRMGLPRQKVNYHLRTLEAHGLVREDSRKRWGGLTERRLVATASSYVVSPGALGPVAADPARKMDRLSGSYLVAACAAERSARSDSCSASPKNLTSGWRHSLSTRK